MSERDRSDRAASPDAPKAKLVERYVVPSGIGRVLALADGTRLRLEPREDGVAVGWTTKVDALTAATTFKRFVGSNIQVHVVHGGSLEETNNSDLLDFVGRFDNVELIRVDR